MITARRPRILILDDGARMANSIQRILGELFEYQHVLDGNSLEQHLIAFDPDIVTLDLMLPTFDTLDFLRNSPDEVWANSRIIVVSALGDAQLEHALMAGAHAAIGKPFEASELRKVVNHNLEV